MSNEQVVLFPDIKTLFMIGGEWEITEKGKDSLFTLAKKRNLKSYNNEYKSVCLRNMRSSEDSQIGFFKTEYKNASSLAMIYADSCHASKTYINCFNITTSTGETVSWVIVVDKGVIDSGSDAVYQPIDRFNVMEEYSKEYNYEPDNEDSIIVYKDYDVEESLSFLAELIKNSNKKSIRESSLHLFKGEKTKIILAIILACSLVTISIIGWYVWTAYQEEQAAIEELLRNEAAAKRSITNLKKSKFPPTWINEPEISTIVEFFKKVTNEAEPIVNGWILRGIDYRDKRANFVYVKDTALPYTEAPGKVVFSKPNFSTKAQKAPFPKNTRSHGIMSLKNAEKWILYFSQGQFYSTKYDLQAPKTSIEKIGNKDVTIIASYQVFKISISKITGALVWDILAKMDVPGMVIKSISYTNNVWKIEGELYVLAKR